MSEQNERGIYEDLEQLEAQVVSCLQDIRARIAYGIAPDGPAPATEPDSFPTSAVSDTCPSCRQSLYKDGCAYHTDAGWRCGECMQKETMRVGEQEPSEDARAAATKAVVESTAGHAGSGQAN